ncbi:oligosaccharide flippase family protein [Actinomycetospora sp.]|uniref:oligosaccharide flippase family protein n=1 Tax=Actinomycetospora sp. TaxID=1872135 RepID=UPI002F42BCE0
MRDLREHQSAATGTAVLMAAIALAAPLNYGFGLALAWLLPAADFGAVSVLLTVLLLATSVLAAGFPWALARRVAREEDPESAAASFRAALIGNVGLGAVLAAGFAGVQLATGAILPGAGTGLTLLVAATIVLLALGQVLIGGLQGTRRFTAVSAARIAEVVVKVAVGLGVVALVGAGIVGVAWALLIGAAAAAGTAWWMYRDRLPGLRGTVAGWREFAAAAPMAVATTGFGLIGTLDVLLLGVLGQGHGVTVAAIGSYQAAAILAKAPFLVGSTLSDVVFPFIARARGAAEAHGWVVTGLRWVPLGLVPMLLVLAVTPDSFIGRLFPADYADAAGPTRVIALGAVGLIVGDMLLKALFARHLAGAAAVRIPAAAVAEVATMALLVPGHGAMGAAAGFAVGAWVGVGVLASVYLRHHPVGALPVRRALAWSAAAGVLTGLLALASAAGPGLDLVIIAVALLVYAALAVGLGAVPAQDVARARGLLGRLTGSAAAPVPAAAPAAVPAPVLEGAPE